MPSGKNIKLNSSIDERVEYILKDYKYFTNNPELMTIALQVLRRIIPKEEYQKIELSLKMKEYRDFVKNLIIYHYDKAYKKTRAESSTSVYAEINLKKINSANIKKAIGSYNYF